MPIPWKCDDEVHEISDVDDALREDFRQQVLPQVVAHYGTGDEIAIAEAYSIWADDLCKEGTISQEVYLKGSSPDYTEAELKEAAQSALAYLQELAERHGWT